jgi:hypothetical protein
MAFVKVVSHTQIAIVIHLLVNKQKLIETLFIQSRKHSGKIKVAIVCSVCRSHIPVCHDLSRDYYQSTLVQMPLIEHKLLNILEYLNSARFLLRFGLLNLKCYLF